MHGGGLIAFMKILLFSLLSFLMFLFLLETILDQTHLFNAKKSWSIADPLIGYRYVPGSHYWYDMENDHPITGVINHHGWRDKDRSLEKSEGTYRIALLGDSFVEAFQVEDEKTFANNNPPLDGKREQNYSAPLELDIEKNFAP